MLKSFYFKSIKAKLLVIIIIMCIIAGVALTVISALMAASALEESHVHTLDAVGTGIAHKVVLLNAAGMDLIALMAHNQQVIQGMEQWNAGTLSSEEQLHISSYLEGELETMSDVFDRLNILDLDGMCVLSSRLANLGTSFSHFEFFTNQKDGAYTAYPRIGLDGNPRYTYAAKVYGSDGEQIGLAMLVISIQSIESTLFSREGLIDGATFLVDSEGTIISSVNGDFSPFLTSIYDLSVFPPGSTSTRGKGYSGSDSYIDKTQVDGTDWFVIVTEPVETVTGPTMNLVTMMVISLIIVIAVGALATFFIANSFSHPIQALTKTSHEIALGNTDVEVEHTGADEIGQLADSFRATIANIKENEKAVNRIAQGEINFKVHIASDLDSQGKTLAHMKETLTDILHALHALSTHSADGDQGFSVDASQFKGVYKNVIESLNKAFSRLQEANYLIAAKNAELQADEEELRRQYYQLQAQEAALKSNNKILSAFKETTHAGFFIVDENRNIIAWNERFAELYDIPLHVMENGSGPYIQALSLRAFSFPERDAARIEEIYEKQIADTNKTELKNGTTLEWFTSPIFTQTGEYFARLWEFVDITEQVQREKDLQEMNTTLEAQNEKLQQQYDLICQGRRKLQESESKYRSIINSLQDMYYCIDENSLISMVSPSLIATLGYQNEEELLGKPASILTHDQNDYEMYMKRLANEQLIFNYPSTFACTDGTDLYCLLTGHLLYDSDGNRIGHEGIARDMSHEKRQEDKLRLKNSLLIALQEAYAHGILVLDENLGVLMYNTQFCNILGVDPGIIHVGSSFLPVYQGILKQIYNQDLIRYHMSEINRVKDRCSDLEFHLSNGKIIHYFTSPVIGENDFYYGRIWEIRDVTSSVNQQKKLEQAYTEIFQKERQLTLALDGIGDGFWNLDCSTNIITVNAEFANNYKFLDESQSINAFISKIHPDQQQLCRDRFHDFFEHFENTAQDTDIELEFQIQSNQGAWRWVIARGVALDVNDDGSPLLVTGTFVNITERKQYERSIQEAHRKQTILSQITRHDVLNQLTVLFSMIDVILEEVADDPSTQHLLKVMDNSLSNVRQHIEFTRDYQELGIFGAGWQDVDSSIAKVRDFLFSSPVSPRMPAGMAAGRPVELIADDIPLIFADPLLDKVVYNLIENSLRHGGEGVTEIKVTFSVENHEGLLVFMDNGKGVKPEIKEKIFENGFGENTGLGLFLVREILGITDITIHECGTVNVGARFEIRVPSGGWKEK